jgi:hypothetical protein
MKVIASLLFFFFISFFLFSQNTEKKPPGFIGPPIPSKLMIKIVRGLNFGVIIPGINECMVRLSPDTAKLYVVNGDCDIYDASSSSPVLVYVLGAPNTVYSIKVSSEIILFQAGGSAYLKVINISPDSSHIKKGVLDDVGRDKFRVGGSLILAPKQPPGSYEGKLVIEVYYE